MADLWCSVCRRPHLSIDNPPGTPCGLTCSGTLVVAPPRLPLKLDVELDRLPCSGPRSRGERVAKKRPWNTILLYEEGQPIEIDDDAPLRE